MASNFDHSTSGLLAKTTRTLLYSPVPAGTTVIVFSGLFTNVDNANLVDHWVTLETYNGTTYSTLLNRIPIRYGSSSMCPKIVLKPGESLYVSSDVNDVITCRVEVLVRT